MSGRRHKLKLFLADGVKIPSFLRRAMRHQHDIRMGHARLGRKRARCLFIPEAEAEISAGGCIELMIPGESAVHNGLFPDSVPEVRNFFGRKVSIDVLLCSSCCLPTAVRIPGSDVIRCAVCNDAWELRERYA